MKAKLGMSPIAWWNDDLVELSDDVSLEECLRQSRSAGFTGMEQGRRFPTSAAEMLPVLKKADVTLCGGWFSGTIVNESIEANRTRIQPMIDLFPGNRGNGRRIESAAEVRAHRHVCAQAQARCILEKVSQLFGKAVLIAAIGNLRKVQIPPAMDGEAALPDQRVGCRWQLLDSLEHRARAQRAPKFKNLV